MSGTPAGGGGQGRDVARRPGRRMASLLFTRPGSQSSYRGTGPSPACPPAAPRLAGQRLSATVGRARRRRLELRPAGAARVVPFPGLGARGPASPGLARPPRPTGAPPRRVRSQPPGGECATRARARSPLRRAPLLPVPDFRPPAGHCRPLRRPSGRKPDGGTGAAHVRCGPGTSARHSSRTGSLSTRRHLPGARSLCVQQHLRLGAGAGAPWVQRAGSRDQERPPIFPPPLSPRASSYISAAGPRR